MVVERLGVVGRGELHVIGRSLADRQRKVTRRLLFGVITLDSQCGIVLKFAFHSLVEFGRVELQHPYETKLLLREADAYLLGKLEIL